MDFLVFIETGIFVYRVIFVHLFAIFYFSFNVLSVFFNFPSSCSSINFEQPSCILPRYRWSTA